MLFEISGSLQRVQYFYNELGKMKIYFIFYMPPDILILLRYIAMKRLSLLRKCIFVCLYVLYDSNLVEA